MAESPIHFILYLNMFVKNVKKYVEMAIYLFLISLMFFYFIFFSEFRNFKVLELETWELKVLGTWELVLGYRLQNVYYVCRKVSDMPT